MFLEDPEVPVDTNHLERRLRPIPMGRCNWLFAWTELGPSGWAWSRSCWPPADCRRSIRTPTWSMSYSRSAGILRSEPLS